MKSKFKILLMLIVTACLLSGCAWLSSSFDIELTDEKHENIYVDMLLPFDTDDNFYTDYNENANNTTMPVLDKNCELAEYSEDGYRSMYIHYSGANLYHSVLNDNSVSRSISLPDALRELDSTPYGEEAFMAFCSKYKKCRFAAFDDKGNILCVSKDVKLKKFPDNYINYTIEWNIAENKIKPHYQISAGGLIINIILSLCSVFCIFMQPALKSSYIRQYQNGKRKCPGILITSGICTTFSLFAVLCWLPSLFFTLNHFDLWGILFVALPIISLIVGIVYFKNFITDMEIFKKSETNQQ